MKNFIERLQHWLLDTGVISFLALVIALVALLVALFGPVRPESADTLVDTPLETVTAVYDYPEPPEGLFEDNLDEAFLDALDELIFSLEEELAYMETLPPITAELLGEDFRITSYCPCEICCGQWSKNRPTANGKPVVFTSSGAFAQAGITVAIDRKVAAPGTWLYIEGVGIRMAQDTGVTGHQVDVYFNTHAECSANSYNQRVWVIQENLDIYKMPQD